MLKDFKRKTCLLIDIIALTNNNISVKEYNQISNYNDLEMEIENMWHFKTTTVKLPPGALDMIKKDTD